MIFRSSIASHLFMGMGGYDSTAFEKPTTTKHQAQGTTECRLADAMHHTRASLNAVMERTIQSRTILEYGAKAADKAQKDSATGEFYATLDEIRDRLAAAKEIHNEKNDAEERHQEATAAL